MHSIDFSSREQDSFLQSSLKSVVSNECKPHIQFCLKLENSECLMGICNKLKWKPIKQLFMLQVLYVGKVRVNQKKISDSFIDDTLDKFRNFELEKERKNALQAAKEEELSSNQVKHPIFLS